LHPLPRALPADPVPEERDRVVQDPLWLPWYSERDSSFAPCAGKHGIEFGQHIVSIMVFSGLPGFITLGQTTCKEIILKLPSLHLFQQGLFHETGEGFIITKSTFDRVS
jgi:hypothetical protein